MKQKLTPFLPEGSYEFIEQWISSYPLKIRISKPRKTKLGDYRYPFKNSAHQISINSNLSAELFLLTLTHEIAHMHAFAKYGKIIQPHGLEWKFAFKNLIIQTFPFYSTQAQKELALYAKNPSATLSSYPNLAKYLLHTNDPNICYIEELNEGDLFKINQKILRRGKLRRTRYLCEEQNSKRRYLVSHTAQVKKYITDL